MRWTNEPEPTFGETRTVTAFLLFPKTIGLDGRWMERASWVEQFSRRYYEGGEEWVPLRWNDDAISTPPSNPQP